MKNNISIAIDGPVGSGKGTLAVALSKKLGALYVYTGAMYRELALACMQEKADVRNEEQILEVLNKSSIDLQPTEKGIKAFLNNQDVSGKIFRPNVSRLTPIVAAFPKVRREMVFKQRKMADDVLKKGKSVVMEGRDIATEVIPNADIKIYLTADINKRAERRLRQFEGKGIEIKLEDVLKDLEERDRQDTQRLASPLRIVEDAVVIDTTNDTIDQTVDKVMDKLRERNLI